MNATLNGRKRPSLNEQIERLDAILDGLSDALNESVAAAVRDAVGLAVQGGRAGRLDRGGEQPRGAGPTPAPGPAAGRQRRQWRAPGPV